MVQEKYALILFDFDKDTIGPENQEIVNRIVARIKTLPQAKVEIVGHTDNIGKEAYNQKLSERRALAVYKLLSAAYGEAPGDRIRYSGVGPKMPALRQPVSRGPLLQPHGHHHAGIPERGVTGNDTSDENRTGVAAPAAPVFLYVRWFHAHLVSQLIG